MSEETEMIDIKELSTEQLGKLLEKSEDMISGMPDVKFASGSTTFYITKILGFLVDELWDEVNKREDESNADLREVEDSNQFDEPIEAILNLDTWTEVKNGDCPMCQHYKSQDELSGVTVYRSPCILCGR